MTRQKGGNKMAKSKDRTAEGLYSIKDILKEAKSRFHITYNCDDEAMKQKIHRTAKNYKMVEVDGCYYYDRGTVETILDELYTYFHKRMDAQDSDVAIDKPSHEIIKENVDQLEKQEELLQKRLNKVGLTRDDYNTLMLDRASNTNNYVTLEEMEFLGLTGLVERSELTEEDTALLECFYQSQQSDRLKEERIKQLYQQKKLEIMITALFNEKFELDASKLHEDITNYVQQGENVFGITTFNEETGEYEYLNPFSDDIGTRQMDGSLDLSGRKSYLRLQDSRFYYTKKKEEKKKSK